MRPTRRTQPYRAKRGREPGAALSAMLAGKPKYLNNPQDVRRRTQKRAKRRGALRRAISPVRR